MSKYVIMTDNCSIVIINMSGNFNLAPRKIIHIDMDCFYAAIEMRENPQLANLPIAVGGSADRRGVLCTCNYQARKFGLHSAMASSVALRKCPELILLPVRMDLYKQVSRKIQQIFHNYTDLVEPLALDEAFLDVSQSNIAHGSATLIAEQIRQDIWQQEQLTASAGVSVNKFIAKVASGWNKPNGMCVVPPDKIEAFVQDLPISKIFGVGKVTANKMERAGIYTCNDLRRYSLIELVHKFGKLGHQLYNQARGIDNRMVIPNRARKSISVENTYITDLISLEQANNALTELYPKLKSRISDTGRDIKIKSLFFKIKYNDFRSTSMEQANTELNISIYQQMLELLYARTAKPIRLLGIGINLQQNEFSLDIPELF